MYVSVYTVYTNVAVVSVRHAPYAMINIVHTTLYFQESLLKSSKCLTATNARGKYEVLK